MNDDFIKDFEHFSKIGWDERYGANRVALNEYDLQARDELVKAFKNIKAEVNIDDAGNIYGSIGKGSGNLVTVGSHMDSVPNGGRFDGMYGVIAGYYLLKIFKEKIKGKLMAIDFTNEEGSRWQPDLQGSGMAAYIFTKDFIYSRVDENNLKFGDVLKNTNYFGSEQNRIKNFNPDRYIELHIEQGPVLEKEKYQIGIPLGIVTDLVNIIKFRGEANQAGPTPMDMRRDALVGASRFINIVNETGRKLTPNIVMTVGEIKNYPNVYSVIPETVELKLDIRSPDKKLAYEQEKYLKEKAREIANELNLDVEIIPGWSLDTTMFDEDLIKIIEKSCQELNLKYRFMYSWATHDSLNMNKITSTAMIMIPSHNGRSHTKEEYSSDQDLINGLMVLKNSVEKLF